MVNKAYKHEPGKRMSGTGPGLSFCMEADCGVQNEVLGLMSGTGPGLSFCMEADCGVQNEVLGLMQNERPDTFTNLLRDPFTLYALSCLRQIRMDPI